MGDGGTDLQTFLLSMASSVMLNLGAVPDPDTGEKSVNLALAKHSIDILCMLREKTHGNLTPEEDQLFSRLLYDLQTRFLNAKKGGQPGS